jgi:peptidoglycan/xylan/chitin deacetylase (PgdA/CDA1 family)
LARISFILLAYDEGMQKAISIQVLISALILFLALGVTAPAAAAPPGAATGLSFQNASCQPDGTVSGNLVWTPSGQGDQYIDLAVDSGFVNYSTGGPYASNGNTASLTTLLTGRAYYARVRTIAGSQQLVSDPLTITVGTCGGGGPSSPPPASTLALASVYSGKCLEVYGLSQRNLATLDQWSCWGGANQSLQAVPQGGGYYELRFAHSGKCLEVLNWAGNNGAPLGQYDCHGGDNQLWAGNLSGGGPTTIRNKFTQKCIDVSNWARDNGSPIGQWDCHGGANQQWEVLGSQPSAPPATGPVIAITIDTDSIRGYMPQMLDILDDYGVKVSFGVTGIFATNNPDLVQRMARSGHTLMNHSWDHPNFNLISTAQRISELQTAEAAIIKAGGVSPKPYFRPPYGASGPQATADVATIGYRPILWNIDPQGWRGYSADVIENNILTNARNGSVVLMHGTDYGDYAALGPTIAALQARGFQFVTIAQMYP